MRLIRAEILKLRRRRGMVAVSALLTIGAMVILFGVLAALHLADPSRSAAGSHGHFDDAVGVLSMTAAVVGVIIGATAGGADIEAGVFRDLAATGRSRIELLLVRVPGAWALLAPLLLAAVAIPAAVTTPGAGALAGAVASVLAAGAVTSTVCVGLAALTGSRGIVIGIALAFQLGVSPLLAQIDALGDARLAIPQIAVSRLSDAAGLTAQMGLGLAIGVLVAWSAVALAAGAWRTQTQEI
jgi:hypothetical protein